MATMQEIESLGLPLTFDEEMRHDFQVCAEIERGRALSILLDPHLMSFSSIGSNCCDLNAFLRVWFWLKAIISLVLGYEVHLWAMDNVDVAAWDVYASTCDYSGYDWTELVVRPGWKLGYDIYQTSSY